MVGRLEDLFPGLRGKAYQVTSPPSDNYNCVAWAAGDARNWWWPDPDRSDLWPDDVARTETLDAFRDAFTTLGYVVCDHAEPEAGYEKVAVFASPTGKPTHAARQLPTGRWTSKLGQLEDIEHDLDDLAGSAYGSVALVLKRPLLASP